MARPEKGSARGHARPKEHAKNRHAIGLPDEREFAFLVYKYIPFSGVYF